MHTLQHVHSSNSLLNPFRQIQQGHRPLITLTPCHAHKQTKATSMQTFVQQEPLTAECAHLNIHVHQETTFLTLFAQCVRLACQVADPLYATPVLP